MLNSVGGNTIAGQQSTIQRQRGLPSQLYGVGSSGLIKYQVSTGNVSIEQFILGIGMGHQTTNVGGCYRVLERKAIDGQINRSQYRAGTGSSGGHIGMVVAIGG